MARRGFLHDSKKRRQVARSLSKTFARSSGQFHGRATSRGAFRSDERHNQRWRQSKDRQRSRRFGPVGARGTTDSLRARHIKSDSIEHARRVAKRIPLTPERLATAFRDPGARTLLTAARAARLEQDTALRGYDATAYERMSVGMGFKRIGRDRLLMRHERAARVVWAADHRCWFRYSADGPSCRCRRCGRLGDIGDEGVAIPYFPGRESLWIGSGLAKADVSESEIIHPLGQRRRGVLHLRDRRFGELPASERNSNSASRAHRASARAEMERRTRLTLVRHGLVTAGARGVPPC